MNDTGTNPSPSANTTTAVSPRKLELILNPDDGSLQTAPLLNVILATTDSLYKDLYNMVHGEIHVTSAQPAPGTEDYDDEDGGGGGTTNEPQQQLTGKSEKMSNLSFAQRRHELAWRLASHAKAIQHVAALTASAALSDLALCTEISTKALKHARTAWVQADEAQDALYFFHAQLFPSRQAPHDVYGALDVLLLKYWPDLPSDLRLAVDRYETSDERKWSKREVSDRWQMAVRSKLLLGEVGWMKQQLQQQQQQHQQPRSSSFQWSRNSNTLPVPWNISLRGGIVRMTHGEPKITVNASDGSVKTLYPLEAILTVLTTNTTNNTSNSSTEEQQTTTSAANDDIPPPDSEWTLVSVEVHVQAKTGQSNHQLDTTNKQRFNMHRLCALAMAREEARARKARLEHQEKVRQRTHDETTAKSASHIHMSALLQRPDECVARPLNALFQVAHYFSLSWQLEILSAQAQALRKGIWGGAVSGGVGTGDSRFNSSTIQAPDMSSSSSTAIPSYGSSIVVTPVQFFENRSILGIVSISFWTIEDRYGSPCMGDLHLLDEYDDDDDNDDNPVEDPMEMNTNHKRNRRKSTASSAGDSVSTVSRFINTPSVTNQLTLSIRAEPNVGIRVSLSGAESIMEFASVQPHIRSTIRELLEATSNPFSLSASEALLAATRLCAERKCYAMVQFLPSHLPSWITLQVEKGSIAVAANVKYFIGGELKTTHSDDPVVLFRLACDSRTGSFVPTFSRSTHLLQYMASNDSRATSDGTTLRVAKMAKFRRTAASSSRSGGSTFTSGRLVRDAFESLSRSMNVLGQRTGIGGAWKDNNKESHSLRLRAIQLACKDVKISLMTCCGMAALYGLTAVTMGVATGVDPSADMSGERLEPHHPTFVAAAKHVGVDPTVSFLPTPFLTVLVDQKLVEHASWTRDGDRLKETFTQQQLFGVCCSVDDDEGVVLYGADVQVKLKSPSSVPTRTSFSFHHFVAPRVNDSEKMVSDDAPPAKRIKVETQESVESTYNPKPLIDEVEHFADILSETILMEKVADGIV
ncbi:hypothetical protein IV203_012476 [Nitzschia inconspicua]|uniref:Uncharacterized protein n=1 Tax=Nitzschia inconspicua TaxID=303405 RepID=A0A9K3KTU2_9STRA|nr:hypothetical protein IV203_012476 [Nitzschia inconspicua]